MIRRLAGSTLEDQGDWLVVRTAANPTYWWGNFLLFGCSPVASDVDRWTRLFETEFPGTAHRAYGVDSTDGASPSSEALTGLDVTADVSTVLTATTLNHPPPVQTEVRRLDGDQDWEQALQLRMAVHDTYVSEAQRLFARRHLDESRAVVESGHGAWFGAFVDGRMASGLGIVSDGTGLARYQSVETHPDHRREGLARRLIYEAGRYAVEHLGARALVILADPTYHAIHLYRSLGFRDREKQVQLQRAHPDPVAPPEKVPHAIS